MIAVKTARHPGTRAGPDPPPGASAPGAAGADGTSLCAREAHSPRTSSRGSRAPAPWGPRSAWGPQSLGLLWGWPLVPGWPLWGTPACRQKSFCPEVRLTPLLGLCGPRKSSVPGMRPSWPGQLWVELSMGLWRGGGPPGAEAGSGHLCPLFWVFSSLQVKRIFHAKPSARLGHRGGRGGTAGQGRAGLAHPHSSWNSALGARRRERRPGHQPASGKPLTAAWGLGPRVACPVGNTSGSCPGSSYVPLRGDLGF